MTSVLRDKNKQVLNQLYIIDNANYGDQENKELSATEIVLMKQKREKNRVMSFSSLFMIIQYILDQSHLNVRMGETERQIKNLYANIDQIKIEN